MGVVNAINKIIQQQDKPSINKIRQVIGYGSLTTISKYFKQWKESDNIPVGLQLKLQTSYNNKKLNSRNVINEKDTIHPIINNKPASNQKMSKINDPVVQA